MKYKYLVGLCCSILFSLNIHANAVPIQGSQSSAHALIASGEALASKGQFQEALQKYDQALVADPASSLAYLRKGGMQVALKGYADSVESFQQAVSLDPQNGSAFIGMAVAFIHMGSYTMADAALKEASSRAPEKSGDITKVITWLEKRRSVNAVRSGLSGH